MQHRLCHGDVGMDIADSENAGGGAEVFGDHGRIPADSEARAITRIGIGRALRGRIGKLFQAAAITISVAGGSATMTGCKSEPPNPTTQEVFRQLGYRDENGDNVIKKKGMIGGTDEYYHGGGSVEYDECDLDKDERVDTKEAWRCLFEKEPSYDALSSREKSGPSFVLEEIKAGRSDEVKMRLNELAGNASSLSDRGRKELLEAFVQAGLKMRDMEMLMAAFNLSGTHGKLQEQDAALRELFHGYRLKDMFSNPNESEVAAFRGSQLIPFLKKKFGEGQDYRLAFSWLCSLTASDLPHNNSMASDQISQAFSADTGSVSRLTQKVIRDDSSTPGMKGCAAGIIGKMGEGAAKRLIDDINKQPLGGPGAAESNKIAVLLALPIGKDTPAGKELRRTLNPFLAKIKAGTEEKSDHKIFHDVCPGLTSDSDIVGQLTAIGLSKADINIVMAAAFDREHHMSKDEVELAKKFRVSGLCPVRFEKGGYASSKDDGGDGPAYHSPSSISLHLCWSRKPAKGLIVYYKYVYSAYSSFMSARLRLSLGGATHEKYYRDSGEETVLLPGRSNELKLEVWQGDHLASLDVQDMYWAY